MLWPGEGVLSATATFSSVPYPLRYKNVHLMLDLAFVLTSSEFIFLYALLFLGYVDFFLPYIARQMLTLYISMPRFGIK